MSLPAPTQAAVPLGQFRPPQRRHPIRWARGQISPRVSSLRDGFVRVAVFRGLFLAWSFVKSFWYRFIRDDWQSAEATLRYSRIMSGGGLGASTPPSIVRRNDEIIRRCVAGSPSNHLLTSYGASTEAARYRREFLGYGLEHALALKYPRASDRPDREGDLLVLKPWMGERERGVLLIQYTDGIRKFAAMYDVPRLVTRYRFVVEPSWWGYEEVTLLMLLGLHTDVVVEAQYHLDYEYIRRLGRNMHPLNLGAGDWADPDTFRDDPRVEKRYDAIMIANWQRLKRHEALFRSLKPIARRIGRVALVGYPCAGRTGDDIRREAARHGVLDLLDIYESVPPEKVSELLRQSKVALMLTKREGANRAIYEALFSDVPVLVSERNVGVNRAHVNDETGVFSSDEDLGENLLRLVRERARYTPRAWALKHTGYQNSTRRLNTMLRNLAVQRGEAWTAGIYYKKNRPHAMFPDARERDAARRHLATLEPFLRVPSKTE